MRSGLALERARVHAKLMALGGIVPDPGGRLTAAAAKHDDAHAQLARMLAFDRIELTLRRARNRLRKLKSLTRMLDRTEHVCSGDVPCRAEREQQIGPVLAELEKLAKRTHHARRERTPIISTKEKPPMSTDSMHRPGQVVEEPPEETTRREQADAARAANGHGPAGIPEVLYPYLARFDMLFRTPSAQPYAMLVHEAARLARVVLDCAPRDQVDILTRIFFRLGMRSAR